MALGTQDGKALNLSLRHMEIHNSYLSSDFPVNCVAYTEDSRFLLSGSADMRVNMFPNTKGSGKIQILFKLTIIMIIIAWII